MEETGYHVVLKPDPEGGYVAVVPAFPGCYSQGESAEEALSNVREASLLAIEDMREGGGAIPAPAAERVRRIAIGAKEGSEPLEHPAPGPDEFSAEGDPLAWEAEGWS